MWSGLNLALESRVGRVRGSMCIADVRFLDLVGDALSAY